jgi:hypothetical protein
LAIASLSEGKLARKRSALEQLRTADQAWESRSGVGAKPQEETLTRAQLKMRDATRRERSKTRQGRDTASTERAEWRMRMGWGWMKRAKLMGKGKKEPQA